MLVHIFDICIVIGWPGLSFFYKIILDGPCWWWTIKSPYTFLVRTAPILIGVKRRLYLIHFCDETWPVGDALPQPETLQLIPVFWPGNDPLIPVMLVFRYSFMVFLYEKQWTNDNKYDDNRWHRFGYCFESFLVCLLYDQLFLLIPNARATNTISTNSTVPDNMIKIVWFVDE